MTTPNGTDPAHESEDPGCALPDAVRVGLSPGRQEALLTFLAQLRAGGMPEPEIHLDGSCRIDLLWREHKLVVRIDDAL